MKGEIKQLKPEKELVSRLFLESFRELTTREREVLIEVMYLESKPLFIYSGK